MENPLPAPDAVTAGYQRLISLSRGSAWHLLSGVATGYVLVLLIQAQCSPHWHLPKPGEGLLLVAISLLCVSCLAESVLQGAEMRVLGQHIRSNRPRHTLACASLRDGACSSAGRPAGQRREPTFSATRGCFGGHKNNSAMEIPYATR